MFTRNKTLVHKHPRKDVFLPTHFKCEWLADKIVRSKVTGVSSGVTVSTTFDEAAADYDVDSDIRMGRFDTFELEVSKAEQRLKESVDKAAVPSTTVSEPVVEPAVEQSNS